MENESERLLPTNQQRKPYHYGFGGGWSEGRSINSSSSPPSHETSENQRENDPWINRANYSRYMYYDRLRRGVPDEEDILLIPPHVIPPHFFTPLPEKYYANNDGKQSSIITIFSIWNTMMGTSLLNIPWAIEHAGVVPGILLLFFMALLACYTAYRILQVFEAYQSSTVTDFAVLCKRLLGKWAQIVAVVFSALTLLGASIVYWVLMSNFLYNTVDFIHTQIQESHSSNFTPIVYSDSIYCPSEQENNTVLSKFITSSNGEFNIILSSEGEAMSETDEFHKIWDINKTVPLFLIAILGPLACIQSPTFFTKFNSLGTLSVAFLFVFIFAKGSKYGINLDFKNQSSESYAPLYTENFPALAGMLSLAFFIHNCIVTIMKNNRRQEKNKRDLLIAFGFVASTYFLIGGAFYVIFPLKKSCIEDNFLDNFRSYDVWTFSARVVLFFQMVTVFPLLQYILRVQVCYALTKKEPTFAQVIFQSSFFIGICVCFAIWFPKIGPIIRWSGAVCGLVYLFFLPIGLYLKWMQNLGRLSTLSIIFHTFLIFIGVLNFVLQFIVED